MRDRQRRWERLRKRREKLAGRLWVYAVAALIVPVALALVVGRRSSLSGDLVLVAVSAFCFWMAACALAVILSDQPSPPFWWRSWALGRFG